MRLFRLAKQFSELFFSYTSAVRCSRFLLVLLFIVKGVSAATYYVDAARPNDTGAGTSWSTAKMTIQAAVNMAVSNDTVLVTNGVYNTGTTVTPGYSLNNRLVITNAITVRSINGPASTIIEGSGTNFYNTSSAIRCVYMKRGILEGFTLNNGTTFGSALGTFDEQCGGGVNMYNAAVGTIVTNCNVQYCMSLYGGGSYYGTLNNCLLSDNKAYERGGGSCGGTLNNCTLKNNFSRGEGGGAGFSTLNNCTLTSNTTEAPTTSGNGGGGVYNCTLYNCLLTRNRAPYGYGGGASFSTLNNCTLANNLAASSGGGAHRGTLINCSLTGNTAANYGGGIASGSMTNCTLTKNTASYGGGSTGGTLINCTLTDNTAKLEGGGAYGGTLNNCSLTGNTAPKGGGIYSTTLNNCIVWDNINITGTVDNHTNGTFNFSCTTPLPSGIGNIESNPLFVGNVNLKLRVGSPCLDAGDNIYTTLPTDLAGATRIQNGTVDMGAYEGGVVAVARPAFSPLSGTSLTNTATVFISCATEGSTLYYTLDESEPTESSTPYIAPIQLNDTLSTNGSISVKVIACKAGIVSAQETALYTLYAATPIFEPPTGTFSTNSLAFSLSCLSSNVEIRYTTNGTSPTISSTLYTLPVIITQSTTVKASAFKLGLSDSPIATAAYTIIQAVATPTVSPASGKVATNSLIFTLACTTTGSSIRYTTDGSEPTSTSTLYSSQRTLTQSATVKAKAFKSGMADSPTAEATYIVIQTVSTPAILPADGTTFTPLRKISMSCNTSGVGIRYTTDGSEPTLQSNLYSGTFNISQTTTFNVKAFKDGWINSITVTVTYYRLLPLSDALNVTNLIVTTGGDKNWFSQTNTTHDCVDAAQSGSITNNQSSWMETRMVGPGTISFWWKASCEDDPDADNWDFISFSVDGIEESRLDGLSEWQQITYDLSTGTHTIRWEYLKDDSLAVGEDCAWVDQLSFIPSRPSATILTPVPVPYVWLDQSPTILSMAGGDYEIAALIDPDLDGMSTWQEYVAGSDPTNHESVFRSLIAISNDNTRITWTPDLGSARVYTVLGRTNLTDGVWGPTNSSSRFFRVNVDMP